jgi:hypothetical protein
MRKIVTLFALFVSLFAIAQKSPSELIAKIYSAVEGKRYDEISEYVWAKSNSNDIIQLFKDNDEKYGAVNYRLKTDSTYRQSKSEPKKYYELKYSFYYGKDLLRYEYIIIKEKDKYKLASVLYHAYKGNYDDPLLNKGVVAISSMFLDYLNTGDYEKAYNLFSPGLQESSNLDEFKSIAAQIIEATGGIESYSFVDTCTALNYYGNNESFGITAIKIKGKKLDLLMNLSIDMRSDVTFFITRYQVVENYQIDNLNEVKAAEKLIDDFYYAYQSGAYEKAYQLLHPELKALKDFDSIKDLFTEIKTASGPHKTHEIVSQIFARNKKMSDLNRFMAVVKSEHQQRTFYDNFMFSYDNDNNLKIIYFYFVEY